MATKKEKEVVSAPPLTARRQFFCVYLSGGCYTYNTRDEAERHKRQLVGAGRHPETIEIKEKRV